MQQQVLWDANEGLCVEKEIRKLYNMLSRGLWKCQGQDSGKRCSVPKCRIPASPPGSHPSVNTNSLLFGCCEGRNF